MIRNISAVFSLFVCFSYCLKIDRCNIGIKSRLVKQVVLPSNCTEGTLYWGYPQGTLQVDIPDKDRFTFCIDHVSDRFVKRARITTAEIARLFKLPEKRDESKCFEISGGMTLELFGPRRKKTFMAFIPYKILRTEKLDDQLKVDPRNFI